MLFCGRGLQAHCIERDETLIAQLIALERRFWHDVELDQAPPADGSESAGVAMRALCPNDSGHAINQSGDPEMSQALLGPVGRTAGTGDQGGARGAAQAAHPATLG